MPPLTVARIAQSTARPAPCPAGTGTRLSLTRLPPGLGTSPLQRDPRYVRKLGLLSCLPRGFNCSVRSPTSPRILIPLPRGTLRAGSRPCPEGSRLEWHLKGLRARRGAGRKGWRQKIAQWQLDLKPRGEGFAWLLPLVLKADSAHPPTTLTKTALRDNPFSVSGALCLCYYRDRRAFWSLKGACQLLCKKESNWERIRLLARA